MRATRAPISPRASAICSPRPREPPVTRATFPGEVEQFLEAHRGGLLREGAGFREGLFSTAARPGILAPPPCQRQQPRVTGWFSSYASRTIVSQSETTIGAARPPREGPWTSPSPRRSSASATRCGPSWTRASPPPCATRCWRGCTCPPEDTVEWQRILFRKGWGGPNWPAEFGRHRLGPGPAVHLRGGVRRRRHAAPAPLRPQDGGAGDQRFGNAAQHAPLPAAHPLRRGLVVPGLLRARGRAPTWPRCGPAPSGRATTTCVNGQKTWITLAQHADWIFCLVRTDRTGKAQAGISFLLIDMKSPGRDGAPHHHARRRPRGERGLVRGRGGAGGEPGRRGEQGLDLRQVPPRPRAGQHRRHRRLEARAASG